MSSQTANPSVKVTDLPLRPAQGKAGRPIQVQINIFPIRKFAEMLAYHYDVKMDPEVNNAPRARQIWIAAEPLLRGQFKKAFIAYDGHKNAFTTADLENTEVSIELPRDNGLGLLQLTSSADSSASASGAGDYSSGRGGYGGRGGGGGRGGRGGRGGGRGNYGGDVGRGGYQAPASRRPSIPSSQPTTPLPTETITIRIKKVATIDFHELLLFMSGKGPETEHAMHAQAALNTVLRHVPGLSFIPVGGNFYTSLEKTPISGAVEIWRGYHQSIRIMQAGHLGVNVDIAATVFQKGEMDLLDLAQEVLKVGDVAAITRVPHYIKRLEQEFKEAKVVTTHRGEAQKRRFRIKKIGPLDANHHMFEVKGVKVSVAQYFLEQYGIKLRFPFLPVVATPNLKAYFPFECLKMQPAQRFTRKLNADQTAEMIRATVMRPDNRRNKINEALRKPGVLDYLNNDYMK
ncbi:Protein argonaute 10, partial [Rhizophlyctis rosea]